MNGRTLPAVFLVLSLAAGCARKEAEPALFGLEQCVRVTLVDGASGAAITGAEDLDVDRRAGRIFASAYDRRKAEKATASRASAVPIGGVYAIDIAALRGGEASFTLRSLVGPSLIEDGLRPHGVSFDADNGRLAFVNRGYVREGGHWRLRTEAIVVDQAAPGAIVKTRVECSANDLTYHEGRLLVTLDHGACGWRAALEDLFGARRGLVVDDKGEAVMSGIGFANGAVMTPDGALIVAATRERALHVFEITKGDGGSASVIKLSAAPDNLTLSGDGRVVAAVHPRLLSIGMQRRLGIGRSPSRVIEVDLSTGRQRVLFDDPKAALVSAATAAVFVDGLLVIGSVIDQGLVVCRNEAASQ